MGGVGDEGYVINEYFECVSVPRDQDLPTSGLKTMKQIAFIYLFLFCSFVPQYTLHILKIYAQIMFYILKILLTDFRNHYE